MDFPRNVDTMFLLPTVKPLTPVGLHNPDDPCPFPGRAGVGVRGSGRARFPPWGVPSLRLLESQSSRAWSGFTQGLHTVDWVGPRLKRKGFLTYLRLLLLRCSVETPSSSFYLTSSMGSYSHPPPCPSPTPTPRVHSQPRTSGSGRDGD